MYITHINIEAALNINITKSAGFVAFDTMFLLILINHAVMSMLLYLYIIIVITF